MNSGPIRSTAELLGLPVKAYAVDISFLFASPQFLQALAARSAEYPNQSSLFRRSSKEIASVVQGHSRNSSLVSWYFEALVLFVDTESNKPLLHIRRG